jgi:hypothetical protein
MAKVVHGRRSEQAVLVPAGYMAKHRACVLMEPCFPDCRSLGSFAAEGPRASCICSALSSRTIDAIPRAGEFLALLVHVAEPTEVGYVDEGHDLAFRCQVIPHGYSARFLE